MTNPYRAMCAELADALAEWRLGGGPPEDTADADLIARARALLAEADGPAVPDGREPASVALQPSDGDLWTMYDEMRGEPGDWAWVRDFARTVLARWGRPAAAPVPEPGEVAELVADELVRQLRTKAATEKANRCHYSATLLTRAADLLQHQHPQPVAVSERMPEPNVKVLAHYFNALGKGRTICAIWVPAKSRSDEGDLDADDFLEYDEEGDKYHWPEGWYEAIENWEELGWAKVYEGEIAYWQPLPQWPAHALPLPTPETP